MALANPEISFDPPVRPNPPVTPRRVIRSLAVVVVAQNDGRFLSRTLHSVLAQTRPATEIVVVDNTSRDETPDVVRSFTECGVRVLRVDGVNLQTARRAGCDATKSEAICFLDGDDLIPPDFLEIGTAQFFGRVAIVDADRQTIGRNVQQPGNYEWDLRSLERRPLIGAGAIVLRQALAEARELEASHESELAAEEGLSDAMLQAGWMAVRQPSSFLCRNRIGTVSASGTAPRVNSSANGGHRFKNASRDVPYVVYTAIFGPYDRLKEPTVPQSVPFLCFTDRTPHQLGWTPDSVWQIVPVQQLPVSAGPCLETQFPRAMHGTTRIPSGARPRYGVDVVMVDHHPHLLPHAPLGDPLWSARWHKLHPPPGESLWIDASVQLHVDARELRRGEMACFRHHRTVCVYDEARGAANRIAGNGRPEFVPAINAQAESYRRDGLPASGGLRETGLLYRSAAARDLSHLWWEEMRRHGSPRDQIALAWIEWQHQPDIVVIPKDVCSVWEHRHKQHVRAPFWGPVREPEPSTLSAQPC